MKIDNFTNEESLIIKLKNNTFFDDPLLEFVSCPYCDSIVEYGNYCSNCGKKLKLKQS